jgi:RNA polymerase sigma-70 factor, ECF subfamily
MSTTAKAKRSQSVIETLKKFEGRNGSRECSFEMSNAKAATIELRAASSAGLDVKAAFASEAQNVRRFLRCIGFSPAEAEDLTAETFLIAHEKRLEFDPSRPARPWLYGIAVRLAKRQRRARWLRALLSLRLEREPLAALDDVEETLVSREDAARVKRALESLPEKKRTLLILREYEGLSAEEIGEALEMPAATVYSALHYARKELLKRYRRIARIEGAE